MNIVSNREKGFTLIELLVALILSTLLIAAIYNLFVKQQRTYAVTEQVVDMQQGARASITRMIREIRMTNFGNVAMVLPATFSVGGANRTISLAINPDVPSAGNLTILASVGQATLTAVPGSNQVTVSGVGNLFNNTTKKFVSIGGLEGNIVTNVSANTLTLQYNLIQTYPLDGSVQVHALRAITYQLANSTLTRDENTGGGGEPMADNIESVQFQYLDENGNDVSAAPAAARIIRLSVTAKASQTDPDFKGGDGYRRRTVTTNIHLRNMGT